MWSRIISVYYRVGRMAVPGDRERLVRLETRAREADIALRQLKSYVQLLKQKADDPQAAAQEAECERVEAENTRLSAQVAQLKQKLVELEVRNGIEQAPHPKPAQLSYNVAGIAPLATASGGDASPALNGANEPQPLQSLASLATEGTAKGKKKAAGDEGEGKKKEKKEKKDKKAGGGEGAGGVDVSRLDFKIGRIISVERHPDADSLYVEQIDIGEDKPRTVCSGLVAHVAMEDMNDRLVIVLCNLKPVKMRGVVSEAMVMCASSPEKVEILDPPGSSTPGERIDFEGYTGQPDSQLNPKKKIFEQIQPDFLVNDKGVATYRGTPFAVGDKGVCRAATMRGSGIK